jgi:hypothetical protein
VDRHGAEDLRPLAARPRLGNQGQRRHLQLDGTTPRYSHHVICEISDDYLKATYSTLERHAALWQAAKKRLGFVLLVVVKHCKLSTLSNHLRRGELYGVPEDAVRLRFREFTSKPDAPTSTAFPGKVFAVSNIPIRVQTHFMGRDDAREAIDAALQNPQLFYLSMRAACRSVDVLNQDPYRDVVDAAGVLAARLDRTHRRTDGGFRATNPPDFAAASTR